MTSGCPESRNGVVVVETAVFLASLRVDGSAPTARYYQLRDRIFAHIRGGRLCPGDRLPPVRVLCGASGLSSATVVRALSELSREGLVETRVGRGTFVAARPAAATEVLIPRPRGAPLDYDFLDRDFLEQILEGVRGEHDDPARRCFLTYVDVDENPAAQILDVCRARHVDGIIVYRPFDGMIEHMRQVGDRVPTVSLVFPVPASAVDLVAIDPSPVLGGLLRQEILRGRRTFVFASVRQPVPVPALGFSPYEAMRRTLVDTLREAGIEPICLLADHWSDAGVREVAAQAGRVPNDALLVAAYPAMAAALQEKGKSLDVVTYTEQPTSLARYRSQMSIIYASLGRCARAAAELLQQRQETDNRLEQRTVRFVPELIRPRSERR